MDYSVGGSADGRQMPAKQRCTPGLGRCRDERLVNRHIILFIASSSIIARTSSVGRMSIELSVYMPRKQHVTLV